MKILKTAILISLLFVSFNSFADLNTGLVAYWSFDDCTAKDNSGNGHDGIINGNPQCINSIKNKAFQFDGNQFITITNTTSLPINSSSRTISAIVKMSHGMDSTADQGILSYGLLEPTKMFALTYGLGDGYDFGVWLFDCVYDVLCNQKTPNYIKSTKYYHLVATYEQTTQLLTTYVGGIKYAERVVDADTGLSNIIIGRNAYNNNFAGIIDEVRIYNGAMSDNEIKQLYNSAQSVSGTIKGINSYSVTCTNVSTKQVKTISVQDGLSGWDCQKAGLTVKPNQKIEIKLLGNTY